VLSQPRGGSKLATMRRAIFLLAAGLAAAAIAGAFVYDPRSQRAASDTRSEPAQAFADQPIQIPAADSELGPSDPAPNQRTLAPDEHLPNSRVDDRARKRQPPDEATARADMRKSATQQIQEAYSLLLEDFALLPREQEDLVALLIEMQTEGMWTWTQTGQIRGREIPEQERHERIAAAIGEQKLQEFLALEENLNAYWETQQIARWLRQRGAPLAETQRDGVFEILVEVRGRYPVTPPPTEIDPRSDEYIDHRLRQTDEFDRHVVELAPSVLSPTQVVHLFNAYEAMSRDRISDVEMQKKRKAAGDPIYQDAGWMTPGRWSSHALRSAGL
jgi:hypothetical protein